MKTASPKLFKPISYGKGATEVTVKEEKNRVRSSEYIRYVVYYKDNGRRHRNRYSKLSEAKTEANKVYVRLANGHRGLERASSDDWHEFTKAREKLEPLNVTVPWLADEYIGLTSQLPKGVTIRNAVESYVARHATNGANVTIATAVEEYVQQKITAGLSEVHIRDLTQRLEKFSSNFGGDKMRINGLSGDIIQKWMDGLPHAARSKRNYLIHVAALMRWAVNRKYASREIIDEVAAIQRPKESATEVEIFNTDELTEILDNARRYDESKAREGHPDILPMIVIGAFAGLRTAEIYRLDWSEIDFDETQITVSGGKAKTGQRRVVVMSSNLVEWLMPYRKKRGPVAPFQTRDNILQGLIRMINRTRTANKIKKRFKWKHNALRHSFCSYRLPLVRDVPKVSYEAGNSPAMIHRHYKSLVSLSAAKAWFKVRPNYRTARIVNLKEVA